jgi:hypothetical protein
MRSLLCATSILLAVTTPAAYAASGSMSEVSDLRSDEDSDVTTRPTDAPATDAPLTQAPATKAPPATDAPLTQAPATKAPATDAPITQTPAPTPKPAKVLIHGGDRTVPAAGFSASVQIVDPSLGRNPVDYSQVAWACMNKCPAPLASLPNGKSFKVTNVPAGQYKISATYKGTVVDSVTFTVTEAPVMFVSITSKFDKPQLTSSPMRVLCVYKAPKTGTAAPVKVSWETNGQAIDGANGKVLNLTPAQLAAFTKGGELPLKCTVTDGTTTGSSAKTVRMIQPLSKIGTCAIAHTDGTNTGAFVSGESKITISTQGWDNDALSFKFFAPRNLPITSATATTSLTTCPFSPTGKVVFRVAAVQEGQIVGETTCEIDVAKPADLKAVADARVNEMEDAVKSGNSNAVLEAALAATSASASDDASDEAAEKEVRTKTITAMTKAFGEKSDMTKDQRSAAVEVMKSVIRKKPAGSGQKAAPELTKEEKTQMRKVAKNILNAPAADVDTKNQGADLLDLFTAASDGKDLKEDTRDLAGMAAENLQAGETQQIINDEVGIFAEKRSGADAVEQPVEAAATTVTLNDDLLEALSVGPEGELATSCVEFSGNTVDVPSDRKMAGKQTEFDVQVDGERKPVSNLPTPIKIAMKSQGADAAEKMKTANCMFFDTDKNVWSTDGVTNGAKNGPQAEVECNSAHLSMFGLLSQAGSTGSSGSASSSATSTDPANLYTGSGSASFTVGAAFAMVLALVF